MQFNYEKGVHDPTIIAHQETFYLFSTDTNQPQTSGIPIRKSNDLVNWEFIGTVFDGVPAEAKKWSGATGLWAPEIIRYQDKYRLYYSASTFGSTTSMIGLAEAVSPEGPWHDLGEVVKTSPELCSHNAIDANVVLDKNNNMWLVYGSFFGGIYIVPMNKESGKLEDNTYGTIIAKRPRTVDTAIEGAFIIYNAQYDFYYLFTSFDSLHNSYNIRVSRSKHINGPYIDMLGNSMIQDEYPEKVGVKILGSHQFADEESIFAPGHNSVLTVGNNQYLVHHARLKPFSDEIILNIRKLFWLSNGWPVVSIENYDGTDEKLELKIQDLVGTWQILELNYESEIIRSTNKYISEKDLIQVNQTEFKLGEKIFKVYCQVGSDKPLMLSGLDEQGKAFFAKKTIT
ncbi:arabinan endo-1,5-alpha-L-arabinosidase [Aerococcaceae bacterium zg-BR9]|uniref:arabinan endo-1,5-alpha-L-arabinosidase n=1 Tax=Aerococcaceae bacterium zg-1292 TaxID=2774330 RepID=UPI00406460E2|nr:arabinan endo-1,5-alpha-L-arabinosidase [Aerococcaceae bacterium zg-BR9]